MKTTTLNTRRLLALLTLAVAGGLSVTAQAAPGQGGHHGQGGPGAMGDGPMMGGMLPRPLERVTATPEQKAQIRQILPSNRAERMAQRQARQALQDEAMALFSQPTVDAAAVEALRQKQLAMHDAASQRMTAAMIEVSRVLTPEQRKQMAEYASQRRDMAQRHSRERQSIDGAKK